MPAVKVVGVEPFEADAMHRSLEAGERVRLERVGIFADGVAVREVGERPFRIARACVDEVVRVTNDEICAAIRDVFDDTRGVMEPAGALAVAGLKRWAARGGSRGARLVAILSGANMNFDRLRFVAERAEVGEQREAVLAVTIPERRGSFRRFCGVIGARNITEFNYRMADADSAHIFVGVESRGHAETARLVRSLRRAGFQTSDLSNNEVAKAHVRHMVGGHSPLARHELLYRFEFPERPGALMKFLTAMNPTWNISLFHYRNHGADYGSILVGMQVPPREMGDFGRFLARLGYPASDETRNPAYRLFLK
jgi:threonine dehydratase